MWKIFLKKYLLENTSFQLELDNILIQTYWHKGVFNHELLSDRELLMELYKYIRIYTSDYFLADILPV